MPGTQTPRSEDLPSAGVAARDPRQRNVAIALAAGALLPFAGRAALDEKIERVWKAKCASCHGADGKGQTEQGKKLGVKDYTSPEWQKAHSDAELKQGISEGVPGMDGYKDKLQPEQIDQLVAHLRSLK